MGHEYRHRVLGQEGYLPAGEGNDDEEAAAAMLAYERGMFPAVPRGLVQRIPVRRNIREGWQRLWADYFAPDCMYNAVIFRRR
jgi:hypothetical protein